MQKIIYPAEVEVLYLLPAIRRQLALYLKERGLGQGEIARILKVSEPSISHYLKAKRATKVSFSEQENEEIRKSAEKLLQNNACLVKETEFILSILKNNRSTCKICSEVTDMPKDCTVCFQYYPEHEKATN